MNAPNFDRHLRETTLLDFGSPPVQALIHQKCWLNLATDQRLAAVYDFAKNDIAFGYNAKEKTPASRILADGYGQCNTKSILLMALLRVVGLPCRFHAFKIDKRLQKGALPWLVYALASAEISHSWVDVWHAGRWTALEGVILDEAYLDGVRQRFSTHVGSFCGYAVAADNLHQTEDKWCGQNTYIQNTAITEDLGVFDSPDNYFAQHSSNITGLSGWLWRNYFYKAANRILERTRGLAER